MSPIAKQSLNKSVAVAKTTKVASKDVCKKSQMNPVQKAAAFGGSCLALDYSNPLVSLAFSNDRTIPDDYVPVMTPSLKAFLYSCLWGGLVLGLIFGAVTFFAYYDPIRKTD